MVLDNHVTLVVWSVTILLTFVVSYFIGRALSIRSASVLVMSIAAAVVTGSFLWLFAVISQPQACKVLVTSPSSGTEIRGYQIDVSGKVEPPTAQVTLIIRSETDKRWWVQDIIKPQKLSGSWSLTAQVGEENVGVNETYELIALASNDSALFNLFTGRFLYKGLTLHQTPGWNLSELILIRRTK